MDGWYDALQDLSEEAEEVEVGHAQLVKHLVKLEGEESIFGRVHQAREEAILDEHCGQLLHALHFVRVLVAEEIRNLLLKESESVLLLLRLKVELLL